MKRCTKEAGIILAVMVVIEDLWQRPGWNSVQATCRRQNGCTMFSVV